MADQPESPKGQSGKAEAALFGLCPRCGASTVFAGWVRFAGRCRACGLDFSTFNVGDGPAAFLTMIIGAVVMIMMIWVQLTAAPPWWVHALLWIPFATAGVVLGLRVAKAALLQSEYRNRSGEGRERT
jgi:uncharacterized protein (DUF983 family)